MSLDTHKKVYYFTHKKHVSKTARDQFAVKKKPIILEEIYIMDIVMLERRKAIS